MGLHAAARGGRSGGGGPARRDFTPGYWPAPRRGPNSQGSETLDTEVQRYKTNLRPAAESVDHGGGLRCRKGFRRVWVREGILAPVRPVGVGASGTHPTG